MVLRQIPRSYALVSPPGQQATADELTARLTSAAPASNGLDAAGLYGLACLSPSNSLRIGRPGAKAIAEHPTETTADPSRERWPQSC